MGAAAAPAGAGLSSATAMATASFENSIVLCSGFVLLFISGLSFRVCFTGATDEAEL
jgi:hypothetical protein